MNLVEFLKHIENIYVVINNRQNEKKIEYINAGFEVSRISFEDIDLEDIFMKEMVPLLGPILDRFKSIGVSQIQNKIYKIYIATLCEMAKSGFNQGGILKTMDTYMGFQFNRNHHYELLKKALCHEGIEILPSKHSHYYEETIIYEAGIPKKFHAHVLSLFLLYWKWMKGIEKQERIQFLKSFIYEEPIYESYILWPGDYEKMKFYREVTRDFKEKTLKVCSKFEEVFCAIDEYPELIDETNIDSVCSQVSENLRYNIKTVIRLSDIHKVFLNYSQKISFNKLQKIINNLLVDESIIIPTGQTITKERYKLSDFYGGLHTVKGVVYEVSFAIGLELGELFKFPRQTVVRQNQNYIYVSDEYFEVEIDGVPQRVKTFIFNEESFYVYVGKVPSASTAYIDDICVQSDESYKLSSSIRKIWDRELKKNILAIYVKEAKCCNIDFAMKTVSVSNGFNNIARQANRNGFSIIHDKWLDIPSLANLKNITIIYSVANVPIKEVIVELNPIMIFSFQSGIQIGRTYDVSQFYGDNRIIIYSTNPFESSRDDLTFLDYWQGLYVYYAEMDLSKETYIINEAPIIIKKHCQAYMSFASQLEFREEKVCFDVESDIFININNVDLADNYYLKLFHDLQVKIIDLHMFDSFEGIDIKSFMLDYPYLDGKWTLSLFKEQENIFNLDYVVLPKLITGVERQLYCEGEKVSAEIFADSNCFLVDNNLSTSIQVDLGIAQIEMEGNLVKSKELEYEVYNIRCDCFQKVSIKPTVWGLRLLDYEKNTWDYTKNVFLSYKTMDKHGVFVCSSKKHFLIIKCNNQVMKREMHAGYNRIYIKELCSDWKEANTIYFIDEFSNKQMVVVAFEPSMEYINSVYENSNMISTLRYEGAVNTQILLRVYVDSKLIKTVSRVAEKNNFLIHIVISEIRQYNQKELTFEVSFDKRDSSTLHRILIEIKDTTSNLMLSEYSNLYKIIEEYVNLTNTGGCKHVQTKSLTVLQLIGGE